MSLLPLGVIGNPADLRAEVMLALQTLAAVDPTLHERRLQSKAIKTLIEGATLKPTSLTALGRLLFTDLNRHVPPFTYFGHHPTTDNAVGVWIDLSALHKAEENGSLVQVDGWAPGRSRYVLSFGGGTLTLYQRRGRREIWRTA